MAPTSGKFCCLFILLTLIGISLTQRQFFNRRSPWRRQVQRSRSSWENPAVRQIGTARRFIGSAGQGQRATAFGRRTIQSDTQNSHSRTLQRSRQRLTVNQNGANRRIVSPSRQPWRPIAPRHIPRIPQTAQRSVIPRARNQIPARHFPGQPRFVQRQLQRQLSPQLNTFASRSPMRLSEVHQTPVTVRIIRPVHDTQAVSVVNTRIQPHNSVQYTESTRVIHGNRGPIVRRTAHTARVPLRRALHRPVVAGTGVLAPRVQTRRIGTNHNINIDTKVAARPKSPPRIALPVVAVKSSEPTPIVEQVQSIVPSSTTTTTEQDKLVDYFVNILSGKATMEAPAATTTKTEHEQLTDYFVDILSRKHAVPSVTVKTEQAQLTDYFVYLLSNQQQQNARTPVVPQVPYIPVATQPFPFPAIGVAGLVGGSIFPGAMGLNPYMPGHMYPAHMQEMLFGDTVDPPDPTNAPTTAATTAATNVTSNASILLSADVVATPLPSVDMSKTVIIDAAKITAPIDAVVSSVGVFANVSVINTNTEVLPSTPIVSHVKSVIISKDDSSIAISNALVESNISPSVSIQAVPADTRSTLVIADTVVKTLPSDTITADAPTVVVVERVKPVDILDNLIVADAVGDMLPAGMVTNLAPVHIVDGPIAQDIVIVPPSNGGAVLIDAKSAIASTVVIESALKSTIKDIVLVPIHNADKGIPDSILVADANGDILPVGTVTHLSPIHTVDGPIAQDSVIVPHIKGGAVIIDTKSPIASTVVIESAPSTINDIVVVPVHNADKGIPDSILVADANGNILPVGTVTNLALVHTVDGPIAHGTIIVSPGKGDANAIDAKYPIATAVMESVPIITMKDTVVLPAYSAEAIVADGIGDVLSSGIVTNLAPPYIGDVPISTKAIAIEPGIGEEKVIIPVASSVTTASISVPEDTIKDTVIVAPNSIDKLMPVSKQKSMLSQSVHDALVLELTKLLVSAQIDPKSATSLLEKIKPNTQTNLRLKPDIILDGISKYRVSPTQASIHIEPLPTAQQLGVIIPGINGPYPANSQSATKIVAIPDTKGTHILPVVSPAKISIITPSKPDIVGLQHTPGGAIITDNQVLKPLVTTSDALINEVVITNDASAIKPLDILIKQANDINIDISLKPRHAADVLPTLQALLAVNATVQGASPAFNPAPSSLLAAEAGIEIPKLANMIVSGTKVEKITPEAVVDSITIQNNEAKTLIDNGVKTESKVQIKSLKAKIPTSSIVLETVSLLEQIKNTSGIDVLMKDPQFRNTLQDIMKLAMKELNKALPTATVSAPITTTLAPVVTSVAMFTTGEPPEIELEDMTTTAIMSSVTEVTTMVA